MLWQYEPSSIEFPSELIVYTDSDWGGDIRTRRSTSGGLIVWGSSTLGTWSKLQPTVALSTAEAEYYSMVAGVQRSLAVQGLLTEMNLNTKLVCGGETVSGESWAASRQAHEFADVVLEGVAASRMH